MILVSLAILDCAAWFDKFRISLVNPPSRHGFTQFLRSFILISANRKCLPACRWRFSTWGPSWCQNRRSPIKWFSPRQMITTIVVFSSHQRLATQLIFLYLIPLSIKENLTTVNRQEIITPKVLFLRWKLTNFLSPSAPLWSNLKILENRWRDAELTDLSNFRRFGPSSIRWKLEGRVEWSMQVLLFRTWTDWRKWSKSTR